MTNVYKTYPTSLTDIYTNYFATYIVTLRFRSKKRGRWLCFHCFFRIIIFENTLLNFDY